LVESPRVDVDAARLAVAALGLADHPAGRVTGSDRPCADQFLAGL
jgi:hypothetical protein